MPELEYSLDALNVRHEFFGAKAIIYVEGDDDVMFWHEVFSQVTKEKFEVEPMGGSSSLDKYIEQIANGQLNAIAARDADFLAHSGKIVSSPRVVYTRGYSIENSLYTSESIHHMAKAFCKTNKVNLAQCEAWLHEFSRELVPLVHLDVANSCSGAGLQTIGDNCSRFMKGPTSVLPCSTRIAAQVAAVGPQIDAQSLADAASAIGSSVDAVFFHVRGHFLASAIHRYIVDLTKLFGRKVSISSEALYVSALTFFSKSLGNNHPHKEHYISNASRAWAAI